MYRIFKHIVVMIFAVLTAANWSAAETRGRELKVEANHPPVIEEGSAIRVRLTEYRRWPLTLTLHADDSDIGDILKWEIVDGPRNGTASVSARGRSAVIYYAPIGDYRVDDSIVARVSDGNGGSETTTIYVKATIAATTYYVDNTNALCSDSGGGLTETIPFCTLTKAASVAVAGDTVRVLAGAYAETVKPNSGTAGSPVTFSAAPGVSVTGAPGNSTNGGAFRITNKSYIVVDGFDVTGTADYGIILDTSNNITISNNHVSYSGTSAIHRIGIYLRATTNSTIIGNTSDHNTMDGIRLNTGSTGNVVMKNISFGNAEGSARNACGINLLANSSFNTIIHNITYANEDTGLNFYTGSSYNQVIGNLTYGNGDHGIDNNAAPNNVFVGNTVHGNVTVGINLEGATIPGSGGATVVNNVMVDNGLLRLVGGGTSTGSDGNLRVDAQSQSGTSLDYNLYYLSPANGGTVQVVWQGVASFTSLAAFKSSQPGQEVNGLESDPFLVGPGAIAERPPTAPFNVAINVGDYHIGPGSAAIDSADSNAPGEPLLDIEGKNRVDDPSVLNTGNGVRTFDDRGAHEFQPLPTAATLSIGGHVRTADGYGIRNATVTVTGGRLSESRRTSTSAFGAYRFDGLEAGWFYIVTVSSRRFVFMDSSRFFDLKDDVLDADFVAEER